MLILGETDEILAVRRELLDAVVGRFNSSGACREHTATVAALFVVCVGWSVWMRLSALQFKQQMIFGFHGETSRKA